MPVIDIELVVDTGDAVVPDLARSLADAVGRTLQSPPGQTWVRLRLLAREHYAENESDLERSELPVFVTVLKRALPQPAELAGEISALAATVSRVTGRAMSCVHVEYAPAASGRLGFGGRLVE
jgi:phenylpyruvate tautomerase PptA (4-oxalocrotonate tautomerase family)